MAALQDAIDAIQAKLATLDGVRAAPDEPPDNAGAFPFVVTYALAGVWTQDTPEGKRGLHDVVVELHVSRQDLARGVAQAMPYAESIPNAIFDIATDQGGDYFAAVDGGPSEITYTFGPLGYGGTETLGFRFTLREIKQRSNIT